MKKREISVSDTSYPSPTVREKERESLRYFSPKPWMRGRRGGGGGGRGLRYFTAECVCLSVDEREREGNSLAITSDQK